jgi:hypothetical protein
MLQYVLLLSQSRSPPKNIGKVAHPYQALYTITKENLQTVGEPQLPADLKGLSHEIDFKKFDKHLKN